uniref:Uncharacterized protein n=1 Tax=Tolypothrix bouteillei VB521301 TaxID=1479485 RepID=A0A0C1NFZ1_9CYAN
MVSNHTLNLLFDKMFEGLWYRYERSCDFLQDKKLSRSEQHFFTGQAIAYDIVIEDLREMRRTFDEYLNEK